MLFLFSTAALVAALVFIDEARSFWWLYALAGVALALYTQKLSSVTYPEVMKKIRAPFSWLNYVLDNSGPVFVGVLMVVVWSLYQIFGFLRATYFQ
jgi:hypothetical protein